jgi:hypothetical protein
MSKRFSTVNGKSTRLTKSLTTGSVNYIARNVGRMSLKAIANVLHRPVSQVRKVVDKVL